MDFLKNLFRHKHEWGGAGWVNKKFDPDLPIPKDCVGIKYICRTCKLVAYVMEPADKMGARFDGYRKKYGDGIFYNHEFEAPKVGDYLTYYRIVH